MRRIIFTVFTAIGLAATAGLTPAAAATPTPVLTVSYAAFNNLTNVRSECAVVVPDISYVIPTPASIVTEATNVTRVGYHSIGGYSYINAGAYSGNVLAKNVTKSGVYPPHEYHAWIPGLFGRSCTEWVQIVAQDG